jgi:imidazolonepropionase-like amidohydrolase
MGPKTAALAGGIKHVGSLEPGMAADMVALPVSPLKDINVVLNVPFVMRDGIVFKMKGIEIEPVQAQVLNEHADIQDAF